MGRFSVSQCPWRSMTAIGNVTPTSPSRCFRQKWSLRVRLQTHGCDRLFPPVPVIQGRKKKDGGHAGQPASDKENAVGMNKAVRGAQAFDLSARKPLQYLSQPGIG